MIKSVHRLYITQNEQLYLSLTDLFDALGLRAGESWKGRRSSGMKFEAREAGVEIGIGEGFPPADLVIEVDSADEAYGIVRARGFEITDEIQDYDWGARMFTLVLPGNHGHVSIFAYTENWRQDEPGAGKLDGRGKKFGIVVSRFNSFITDRLLGGALDALLRTGVARSDIHAVRVPGSYEIPIAARKLAETRQYDAIVCLGCLIRGETLHYEVIANEVTRGIGQSAQETGVPHALGVLTCDTLEQAIDRAGLKTGNKGYDAGLAAVEMANLGPSAPAAMQSASVTAGGKKLPAKKSAMARSSSQPARGRKASKTKRR